MIPLQQHAFKTCNEEIDKVLLLKKMHNLKIYIILSEIIIFPL